MTDGWVNLVDSAGERGRPPTTESLPKVDEPDENITARNRPGSGVKKAMAAVTADQDIAVDIKSRSGLPAVQDDERDDETRRENLADMATPLAGEAMATDDGLAPFGDAIPTEGAASTIEMPDVEPAMSEAQRAAMPTDSAAVPQVPPPSGPRSSMPTSIADSTFEMPQVPPGGPRSSSPTGLDSTLEIPEVPPPSGPRSSMPTALGDRTFELPEASPPSAPRSSLPTASGGRGFAWPEAPPPGRVKSSIPTVAGGSAFEMPELDAPPRSGPRSSIPNFDFAGLGDGVPRGLDETHNGALAQERLSAGDSDIPTADTDEDPTRPPSDRPPAAAPKADRAPKERPLPEIDDDDPPVRPVTLTHAGSERIRKVDPGALLRDLGVDASELDDQRQSPPTKPLPPTRSFAELEDPPAPSSGNRDAIPPMGPPITGTRDAIQPGMPPPMAVPPLMIQRPPQKSSAVPIALFLTLLAVAILVGTLAFTSMRRSAEPPPPPPPTQP